MLQLMKVITAKTDVFVGKGFFVPIEKMHLGLGIETKVNMPICLWIAL